MQFHRQYIATSTHIITHTHTHFHTHPDALRFFDPRVTVEVLFANKSCVMLQVVRAGVG